MAGITIVGGIGMVNRFTQCNRIIVATGASSNNLAMIHVGRLHRCPRYGPWLMAGIAGIGTVNVITRLATRDRSIMTTRTYADDLIMIHRTGSNRYPARRENIMTGFTYITGCHMRASFATGRNTVMTTNAVAGKG